MKSNIHTSDSHTLGTGLTVISSIKNNLIYGNVKGGLGNQLFIIYTTLSLSIRYNKEAVFLNTKCLLGGVTKRYTYWDSIFKNITLINKSDINKKKWVKLIDDKNHTEFKIDNYRENIIVKNNIMLLGYFQSFKNFIEKKDEINRFLDIPKQIDTVRNKYKNIKKNIGIHFRLGDYKHLQKHHPILPNEYYINCLNNIEGRVIIVFCEYEDIKLVKERMDNIISRLENKDRLCKIFTETNDELEQMFLLSCFKNIVIANSTFSWWSGFFSKDSNVFIPNKWFHKKTSDDLILDNWIGVDV